MTTPNFPGQLERLRKAFEAEGIRGFWLERIEMLEKQPVPAAYVLGQYHARLGQNEQALDWYHIAQNGEEFETLFFANDPANHKLLEDPRARRLANELTAR
jgi:hypothetical protein